jgi:hypothetical protein
MVLILRPATGGSPRPRLLPTATVFDSVWAQNGAQLWPLGNSCFVRVRFQLETRSGSIATTVS